MDTSTRLLIFLDVIERGSFAKAAQHRNIDRSVISKQISKLEEELSVRLLNRTTRSFSLTAAGAEMVKKAQQLRKLLSETHLLAENYHTEPKGLLRITSSTIIGRRYVQPVINEFQKRFPQVEIELRLEDRLVDIVGEGYDLAFRVGEPKDSSLIARKIARNRLIILATSQFISTFGEPKSMADLSTLPAASYASEGLRFTGISYLNDNNELSEVPIKSIYRSNDGELLITKVLSDTAFCTVPAFLVDQEVINGLLTPLMTHVTLIDYAALYAVYPHRDLPVRTRLFFDAMREYIGKDVPIWEKNIPNFDSLYGFKPDIKLPLF
ncbi:HTH-type transcriptional regulator DmlR [Pseudoalteromonas holothuriae]|uniref:HTH-type transcriptional regulator DmlR n=1 Tax=Pseudoalteromonas holothuriae TaxID=2963714 RepID=A0ABM9GH71_9GAMM|nr:LysR family transcriptional regulator [Pseudoalteromonas sp. CIP111951]CAH9057394.1 HTH-type transcriptional regulator DmlR [Pseudoalteromonas sp. CIP111951]